MFPTIPDGTPGWWYVTAIGLAVMVIGVAKSGFGGGIAIVAVPLIANAVPADRAVGLMLPLLILADVFSNAAHFRKQSPPHLTWLVTGALVGIAAGTGLLIVLQAQGSLTFWLNLLVGSLCLLFVAVQCYRLMGGALPHIPPGAWGGRGAGFVSGLASTFAHSAGPVASIYLLEQRLAKTLLVGTMVLFFAIVNVAKLPTFIGLGLMNWQTLIESIWFMPLVPVGSALGLWMHKRIPERPFTAVMYLGAAAAAANMLYKAANG